MMFNEAYVLLVFICGIVVGLGIGAIVVRYIIDKVFTKTGTSQRGGV